MKESNWLKKEIQKLKIIILIKVSGIQCTRIPIYHCINSYEKYTSVIMEYSMYTLGPSILMLMSQILSAITLRI